MTIKIPNDLWQEINTMLACLTQPAPNNVVEIVREYYAKYNNDAPPESLRHSIAVLQRRLDESVDTGESC